MDFAAIDQAIGAPDEGARLRAHAKWNRVAKPIGGLGSLEALVEQIAALTGSEDVRLGKRCALVMCADNGVVAQGVAQTDASVTRAVAESIARGSSSVCRMARVARADTFAVDMGMAQPAREPGVIDAHVARGTADISSGPAMTAGQCEAAVRAGIDCARTAARQGYAIVAVGEMGIGNTTTASALACALLGLAPEEAVGRGAGLSDEGLACKVDTVRRALKANAPEAGWGAPRQRGRQRPEAGGTRTEGVQAAQEAAAPPAVAAAQAFHALQTLGGFDITGMVGAYLGCALARTPAIVDGAVSAVAALVATMLCPASRAAMLPSHLPSEPSSQAVFRSLGLQPVLHAGMHLGEATGAVCLLPLLDMALALYDGTTFEQTGIEAYEEYGEGRA